MAVANDNYSLRHRHLYRRCELQMNVTTEPPRRLKHIIFPDGIAIEPAEVLQNSDDPVESSSSSSEKEQQRKQQYCEADASATADLFVTMVSLTSKKIYLV